MRLEMMQETESRIQETGGRRVKLFISLPFDDFLAPGSWILAPYGGKTA